MNVVNYTFPRTVLIVVFYPFTQLFEKLNFPKMILLQRE